MTRLLTAVIALSALPAFAADPPASKVQKWEYKVMTASQLAPIPKGENKPRTVTDLSEALNKLGQEGWELAGVVPGNVPNSDRGINSLAILYQNRAKRAWEQMAGSNEKIDVNAAENAEHLRTLRSMEGFPIPDNGVFKKEVFEKAYVEWLTKVSSPATPPTETPLANRGEATYYLKRPIP